MIFENVGFYFKEAILSFKRSTLMSIAAIISTTAILVIVGMFLLILTNSNYVLKNLESQIEIIAYLKDNISKSEMNSLESTLSKIEGVKEIKFVSKEEAYQRLSKDLGDQRDILSAIEINPLPASYEITVRDTQTIKQIAVQIVKFEKVEDVEYGQQIVEKMLNFIYISRIIGIIILFLLIFASILITSNIIKISVYARRYEIEIMSLVGSTRWFIRWPFIIEGFLQGSISAILSILILYYSYFFTIEEIYQAIPFLPLIRDRIELLPLGIAIAILGSLMGILGSMFSVGKYLNG